MNNRLRVGILAGEASGDILGAALMRSLNARCPDIEYTGIGGPLMREQGLVSQVAMDRLSVMGLVEPLKRLPELLHIRRQLRDRLLANPPDVFIGIDSPDFNLGLEKQLRRAGIRVVHYVSPSVWAWRRKRIHSIREAVDLMLCLFPFEQAIYEEHGVPVLCTGHTLADQMPMQVETLAARDALGLDRSRPVLAILPGSRHGEVSRLAPDFLDAALIRQQQQAGLQVVIPAANEARHRQLSILLDARPDLNAFLVQGQSRTVMAAADSILIASGTATLEALLCKKPMVVAYRMAPLSYTIISRMLKVPYFSLPNLLAAEKLVTELVQAEVEPIKLARELARFTPEVVAVLEQRFTSIHQSLRRQASETAADAVLALVNREPE